MKSEAMTPHFHTPGRDPEKDLNWKKVDCEIKDHEGRIFFKMTGVEAPDSWSQLAVEIAASKYFRKSGVPKTTHETGIRQMVQRVTKRIAKAGREQGHFKTAKDEQIFERELRALILQQRGLFNSPVWFNYGLAQAYKAKADTSCYVWNPKTKKVERREEALKNPQVSACFIQKIEDNLESIFELAKNEARLFKFGSGSGTNFSALRARDEKLEGGGTSSGLIAFLEVLDRGAGAVKSGGTTRRAAKMVILDVDHPEVENFIQWKVREEQKARALMQAGFGRDYESEAYRTVSGQNANNSVRVPDRFMKAVAEDAFWELKARTTGKVMKHIQARDIWRQIADAAWACADPGLQFDDTINAWHTCPKTDRIYASNPCSEYMFLEDSACNLASLNLLKFVEEDGHFNAGLFAEAARVFFRAQEILVDDASYPTAAIAANSHRFRPLGLGYAGLGAFLMQKGIPYDSETGRAWGAALAALVTGVAYDESARMAKKKGAFEGFRANKMPMLKVLERHRRSLNSVRWDLLPGDLSARAELHWDSALALGKKHGYRNAQATVIAPTGTIGLVMDSETTGIEPEFSLVKRKKLSGGGELRILSHAFEVALKKLGYTKNLIEEIRLFVDLNGTLQGCPQIKAEHQDVFATAMEIAPRGHLMMMAAIQPFVSGAISKTVNMPADSTSEDIANLYWQAWEQGLKAIAIYRDGSKGSQPLEAVKSKAGSADHPAVGKPVGRQVLESAFPKCFECGSPTELAGACFRCTNCGSVIGCS